MSTVPSRDVPLILRPDGVVAKPGEATRFQSRARLALALALVALGAWTLHNFLAAIAWAVVLAIATWPLYQRAGRRIPPGRHNILLPTLFTLAVALVFLVPLALAGIQLGREMHNIVEFLEGMKAHGMPAPEWVQHLPFGSAQATDWWQQNLGDPEGYSDFVDRLREGSAAGYGRELGGQLVRRVVIFAFTLLTLFFLYRDGGRVSAQMLAASARAFGPHGERIGRQMIASVHGTVDGLVLVGLGEGVLFGISYWLAGVPHPTLLGALSGVAAMIPFAAVVVVALVGVATMAGGSATAAIAVVAFGYAVIFVADHFIRPVLIGGATKLPFLWVLLGILGGVETWGLLGLFVGPALMAALVLIWRDWTRTDLSRAAET